MTHALAIPPNLQKAHLAYEMASNLLEVEEILQRHELTREQLDWLCTEPDFVQMLKESKQQWSSPLNVRERVRIKAAMAAEDGLAELYGLFRSVETPATQRLDAYKQLTALADVQPRKETDGGNGSMFSLTINVSGEAQAVTIDGTVADSAEAS